MKRKKSKMEKVTKITLVVAALFSGQAGAAIVIEHSGKVELSTRYHSNLQFLNDKTKESVYLYSIIPRYQLAALDGRNKWYGTVGVNLERSSNDNVSGDREDPFGTIGWEHALQNGLFSIVGDYSEESSRTTQFGETGVLTQDGTTTTRSVVARWEHSVSQKLKLKTDAGYESVSFDGVSLLSDYQTRTVGAELMYEYNERISPYVKIVANDYRAQGATGNSKRTYQTYLGGAEIAVNPKLSLNVNVGHVEFNGTKDEWTGEFEATYAANRHEVVGRVSRAVFPTGLNNIELGDEFTTDYSYLLSERSRLGAGVTLTQNNSNIDTQELSGFYDRDLSRSWLMRLELSARNQKIKGAASVDDISAGIFFTYTSPKF